MRPSKAKMKKLNLASIICLRVRTWVARIPAIGYCADAGQTMVYFDNWGKTWVDPEDSYVRKDRGIGDAISDHDMAGYSRLTTKFCSE